MSEMCDSYLIVLISEKTKENIEKVFKTVRQRILSDKSDIGYLEVVTIYLEQQQFNQVLQTPPKHDERSGLFEVLLKSVTGKLFKLSIILFIEFI